MLSIGCRPGEAFGLKWKHLNPDCSVIWIGESWSRGQQKTAKTNKERAFTLTPRLQKMLLERKGKARPDDLVFPAKKGGHLDDHNFRNRAWKAVLAKLNIPLNGAIVEVIAGLNFYLYGKTASQMAQFQERLDGIQRYLLADSLCERLEGEHKHHARIELILAVAKISASTEKAG